MSSLPMVSWLGRFSCAFDEQSGLLYWTVQHTQLGMAGIL